MNENEIGKVILIGINYFNTKNELLEQYQTGGIIDSITKTKINIKREGYNELFVLPNDDRALMKAKPGEYRERTTGKIITNPDFIAQWTIHGDGTKEHLENYKRVGFDFTGND